MPRFYSLLTSPRSLLLHLHPPLPRARPQCLWRSRSQLPLRGSAGVARGRHRLPVLIPWRGATGTDGHKIVGGHGSVNTKCCVEQRVSARRGFHGFRCAQDRSPSSLILSVEAAARSRPA